MYITTGHNREVFNPPEYYRDLTLDSNTLTPGFNFRKA